ncbi:MAG: hypothetical protein CSB55_06200 [Candidatus Cloacimonadota bacterium]|nr:MAG: hypothetical protein CSB55_06200 [Candidatus Cloacimonadota bacterium]
MDFNEKFLYHIWDGLYFSGNLVSCQNREIKIIHQGHRNTGRGPDFKDAVIMIDDKVYRGDIEIHLKTKDWEIHGHCKDPYFDNVILHCVYEHNSDIPFTVASDGKLIPVLEMKQFLSDDIKKLYNRFGNLSFTPANEFCLFFSRKENAFILKDLEKSGLKRFEEKVQRFAGELVFSNFSDLILRGIFEAFGYSKNKFQMGLLFDLLSEKDYFNKIKSYSYRDSAALIIGYAGLFDSVPKTFSEDQKSAWIEIFNKINNNRHFTEIKWEFFRLRPVNHPVVRLLQLTDFLYSSGYDNLFGKILTVFNDRESKITNKKIISSFLNFFHYEESILPEHFHTGRNKILSVLFNIIYPVIALYARKMNFRDLEKKIFSLLPAFPGLSDNHLADRMSRFMTESQIKLIRKRALTGQGLLKIYFDYCRYRLCKECIAENS